MGWIETLTTYLIFSSLLGEGLVRYYKEKGQRTSPWEYIIIITVWPLCILATIIMKFRSK